jgi:mevalonate kinase
MKVIVSAPGKIHLMGEHAVVYGKPALLTAVNRRLSVTIEQKKEGREILVDSETARAFIEYAISIVEKEYDVTLPAYTLTLNSDIPFGYHLGSSAAVAVATIGAAIYFSKKLWNPTEINRLAYEVEKKQHGNPSGGDNTAVTFGGFLWYRKELEFLKSLWQLQLKLPENLKHFYLINTGKPEETTGEMVKLVSEKLRIKNEELEKVFAENEKQTKRIAVAIKEGNSNEVLGAIRDGEKTLEEMGVVSDMAIQLIKKIEKAGGAAKILGGGGKKKSVGFVLVYSPQKEKVEKALKGTPYILESVELGAEGVRLEKKE